MSDYLLGLILSALCYGPPLLLPRLILWWAERPAALPVARCLP